MLEFHFEKKPLHTVLPSNGSAGDLQTIDYSYHIRGGLRGVNLDASGNLTNKMFSMKLGYEDANFFDGNIGKQEWKTSLDNVTRSYTFSYDGASRILGASYVGNGSENYSLENMSYDLNGNITSLWRKGMTQNNTFDYIDKLGYSYGANSNKINAVRDAVSGNLDTGDFRDGNTLGNDYDYWLDGSLKKDLNKGISQIDYNYLKLPQKVTYSNGNILENQYDATGKKLKSISSDGITYDFLGNIILKNNVLYQIGIDEGRVVNEQYEYDIKDHLGNLRVSFRDSLGIARISTKLDYDPWGLTLKGLTYTNPTLNKNNFQFGSKEKIESFGLNWIDFGARIYMPDVPHFITIDPMAEKREWVSPYNMAQNNPINRIDPDGALDQLCCGDDDPSKDEFLFAKLATTAFYDTKHAIYNTAFRTFGSSLRAGYKVENGSEVFETQFTRKPVDNSIKGAMKEVVSALADVVSIVPGGSTEGKLLAETSKSQTSRAVKAVVAETNAGKGNLTSGHTLTQNEALEAGIGFVGKNAKEIGKSGSGVYRSQNINKDGTINQFRMDANSVQGNHPPNVPHVHLEVINPVKKNPVVNNHIPIK